MTQPAASSGAAAWAAMARRAARMTSKIFGFMSELSLLGLEARSVVACLSDNPENRRTGRIRHFDRRVVTCFSTLPEKVSKLPMLPGSEYRHSHVEVVANVLWTAEDSSHVPFPVLGAHPALVLWPPLIRSPEAFMACKDPDVMVWRALRGALHVDVASRFLPRIRLDHLNDARGAAALGADRCGHGKQEQESTGES